MKGILNKRGEGQCYNFTSGKIYNFTEESNTEYIFINDVGYKQYVSKLGTLEVPDGYFVVRTTEAQQCYSWEVGDYLVATDDDEEFYKILHSDFTVCRKHHAEKVSKPMPPKAPRGDKGRAPKLVPDTLTSENKKIIKKQKALAAELLERLGFYGNAIIAGGAPRNWWFNRPANDLDIFLPAPQDFTGKNLRAIMEREGITDVFNMATHNPDGTLKASKAKEHTYDERMSDIHSVFEGKYCGQQVQVIWINVSTYGYIESHFDTSINMIFSTLTADGDIAICPTREFNQGVETGAIYVHDNQAAYTNAHLEKVANYFPDVPLVWYEELKDCVKNPSLVLEVAKSWEDHIQDQLDA